MSIPKFKRKSSGLEYVDNASRLQKEIMTLFLSCLRDELEMRATVDKLACMRSFF